MARTLVVVLAQRVSAWPRRLARALARGGRYEVVVAVGTTCGLTAASEALNRALVVNYNDEGYSAVFVPDWMCAREGFVGSRVSAHPDLPLAAWDRALAYVCLRRLQGGPAAPPHVWFLQEDVFAAGPGPLTAMDARFPDADLLCKELVSREDDGAWAHWRDMIRCPRAASAPLARAPVAACRVSRRLLLALAEWVRESRVLPFLEIAFASALPDPAVGHPRELAHPGFGGAGAPSDGEVRAAPDLLHHPLGGDEARLLRLGAA